MQPQARRIHSSRRTLTRFFRTFRKQYQKQMMVFLGIAFLLVFAYYPMYGVQIAFKKLSLRKGIWASPWVGFRNFEAFLTNSQFKTTVWNTLKISLTSLFIVFPMPIVYALLLNELRHIPFKRTVQTISYLPHFVSWVIVAGMIYNMFALNGLVNKSAMALGIRSKPFLYLGQPNLFLPMVIVSSIWKGLGWSSIIYLSALSGIDPQQYEAAVIDGASRFARAWYITLPGIGSTVAILFIFACSGLLNTNFDQVYLLQNQAILSTAETLDTYTYKVAIEQASYEYGTAVSLFKAVIGFTLLVIANKLTKQLTDSGLW